MTFGIATFLDDRNLLGKDFAAPSWWHWKLILRAALGERLLSDEVEVFREIAGGRDPPQHRVRELWLAIGRRAGKDSIASALATYLAIYGDFKKHLRRGEKAVILCLALDRMQAAIVFGYIRAYFEQIPLLRVMLVSANNGVIELTNDVEIIVATNSFRAIRGRTVACAILDEIAFWFDEHFANPDVEVYSALMPSLISLRQSGSMLIGISTVYRRTGLLYEKFVGHHGKSDDDVLFVRAAAVTFNPLLLQPEAQAEIERLRQADPQRAAAEWDSEWRSDLADFLDRQVIEALVDTGVRERPYDPKINGYVAYADLAGGAASDSAALSIAHPEDDIIIQDLVRVWRPPFSASEVVNEIAAILKSYRLRRVTGDKYAGGIFPDLFRQNGIEYQPIEGKTSSDNFLDLLPIVNSRRCRLLDHREQLQEFIGLERRTSFAGKQIVGHASHSNVHDDIAVAATGSIVCAALDPAPPKISDELLHRMANFRTPYGRGPYGGVPVPLVPAAPHGVPMGPHSIDYGDLYRPSGNGMKVI
jgi:hypothetical protein